MEIPNYAIGTLSDLLEQRIEMLEEIILEKFSDDGNVATDIDEMRTYFAALVEQLNADASAKGITSA